MNRPGLKMIETNLFKSTAEAYKLYSCIPDKYMSKQPAIKDWSRWCTEMPGVEEVWKWGESFPKSYIAVCLGPASEIVALDIDCIDPKIMELIEPILPKSPVVKKGAKGETRFLNTAVS